MEEIQIFRKVAPRWVALVNQVILPCTRPALYALLAKDRGFHSLVRFEPNQTLDTVTPREALNEPLAVLPNAARQVRSDACVSVL
jgi:hypothetical protein